MSDEQTTKRSRRKPGTGSVTELGPGRFWVRLPTASGKIASLDVWPTHEEAVRVLDAAIARLAKEQLTAVGGTTLSAYMPTWIDRREKAGVRAVQSERSRMRCHVLKAPFAHIPMRSITRGQVADWLETLPLAPDAATLVLILLRGCLAHAKERGVIETNVVEGLKVAKKTRRTEEPWTFLDPTEQRALLESLPEPERHLVAFNIGTGLRRGEMWCLELRDIHVDVDDPYVFVRYGSPGHPPKNGKTRRVSLFGLALNAARAWLAALSAFAPRNPLGLVFCGERGGRRKQAVTGWSGYVKSAKIGRRVRWHDLRHTFASSLVAGWWGRAWRLEEVKEEMGHSSIIETQRYAHLGETARKSAAREARERYGNIRELAAIRENKPIPVSPACTRETSQSAEVSSGSAYPSLYHHLADLILRAVREREEHLAGELASALAWRMGVHLASAREGYWRRVTELCERVKALPATELPKPHRAARRPT